MYIYIIWEVYIIVYKLCTPRAPSVQYIHMASSRRLVANTIVSQPSQPSSAANGGSALARALCVIASRQNRIVVVHRRRRRRRTLDFMNELHARAQASDSHSCIHTTSHTQPTSVCTVHVNTHTETHDMHARARACVYSTSGERAARSFACNSNATRTRASERTQFSYVCCMLRRTFYYLYLSLRVARQLPASQLVVVAARDVYVCSVPRLYLYILCARCTLGGLLRVV